jgi:hypothetical protein
MPTSLQDPTLSTQVWCPLYKTCMVPPCAFSCLVLLVVTTSSWVMKNCCCYQFWQTSWSPRLPSKRRKPWVTAFKARKNPSSSTPSSQPISPLPPVQQWTRRRTCYIVWFWPQNIFNSPWQVQGRLWQVLPLLLSWRNSMSPKKKQDS